MSEKQIKKPVILFLLQGMGLSFNWQKNAIANAKAVNFDNLWKNYTHTTIRPILKGRVTDKRIYYKAFFNNAVPKTDAEMIEDEMSSKNILENKQLKELFAHIVKHNSKLHLIGTISENHTFCDLNNLYRFLKLAKINNVYEPEIHLFVDFSTKEILLSRLSKIEKDLTEFPGVSISTINSLSLLKSNDTFREVADTLLNTKGKKILSFEQMFYKARENESFDGSYILNKNRNFPISDFDGVIFFDSDNEVLKSLSKYLLESTGLIRRLPKYLKVIRLLSDYDDKSDNSIIVDSVAESFLDKVSPSMDGIILASNTDLKIISSIINIPKKFLLSSMDDLYEPGLDLSEKIKRVSLHIENLIRKYSGDFILIDFPFIPESCQKNDFNKTTQILKLVDGFLKEMEDIILEKDGVLILSSLYGMAEEKTVVTFPYGQRVVYTQSPLPIIQVGNNSKKPAGKSYGLDDSLNIKYNISLLKLLVLKSLGIN